MATNKKITELTEVELGGIADDDVLVIVDISENETKKVRRSTLRTDLAGVATLAADSPLAVDASIGNVTVSISGQVPVNNGGTGASTAAAARTNLGLGTISTQDYTAVNIDGGAIDGTPIGATTQSTGGFSSLTIASSTAVTSVDTDLTSVSASDDTLASAKAIKTYVDAQVGTVDTLSEILANGNTTGANNIIVTAGQSITVDTISETTAANGVAIDGVTLKDGGATVTADVNFGDNDKAIFGAGSDLQIYHDAGGNSFINESGTGSLVVKATNTFINATDDAAMAAFYDEGQVELYYNASKKFETTSTGIDVTGTITFDGGTTSADLNFGDNDKAIFGAGSDLQIFHDSGGNSFINESGSGSLVVKATNTFINATDDAAMAAFYDEGQVELYHNASKKFETTSTGIDVTGDVGGDTATITGSITSNPASGANILFQNGSGTAVGRVTFDSTNLKVRGDSSKGLKLGSNGSDVITIDTSGNVGIGTTSPGELLTLSAATPALRFVDSDTSREAQIVSIDGNLRFDADNANAQSSTNIAFRTDGSERVRIDSSGNVGIGTSNPVGLLDLDGGSSAFTIQLKETSGAYQRMGFQKSNDLLQMGEFNNDGSVFTPILNVSGAGDKVGIGTTTPSEKLSVSGNVTITGSISKGSGSFRISHPLQEKSETHDLVHSFIEGPKVDLIYRGKIQLQNGEASINIDEVSMMTDGTFEVLCDDVQCFTTNETGWTAVKGSVSGNILTIQAQEDTCTDIISWMVIGERKDQNIISSDLTDSDGKLIVEPLKS